MAGMGRYVLEGLSETERDAKRKAHLEERREILRKKLERVNEDVEEMAGRRRKRMETDLFYKRAELGRVKQAMSSNPVCINGA